MAQGEMLKSPGIRRCGLCAIKDATHLKCSIEPHLLEPHAKTARMPLNPLTASIPGGLNWPVQTTLF